MEHQSPTLLDANGFPIKTRSLLFEVSASNDAQLDFTGLDDTFPRYVIEGGNVAPNTDEVDLNALFSIAGDFKSGASDYSWIAFSITTDNASGTAADDVDSRISTNRNTNGVRWGSSGDETGNISFTITRGSAGNYPKLWSVTVNNSDGNFGMHTSGLGMYRGVTSGATPSGGIDGVRLFFSTGLIQQGTFRLYGVE